MPNVLLSTNTVGAEIRYSTDGNDVTEESTLYSGQFSVEAGVTVKAKAFKTGMNPSPQSELASFQKLQTPTLSLSRSRSVINITLGNTVEGATYRYKVGSAPTSPTDGTAISGSATLDNSSALTIYVVGWKTGTYNPSEQVSQSVEQYTPTLQTPTLSCQRSGSTVTGTIGNTVSGATYVYKVGSAPSSQSDGTVISGTTFSFVNNNSLTVYVRGFMGGYAPSSSVSVSVTGNYPLPGQKLPTPVVSMNTLNFGAKQVIRFTFNNKSDYSLYADNPDANIEYFIYRGDPSYYDESVNLDTVYYDIDWSEWNMGQPDISIYASDYSDTYIESNRVEFSKESIIASMNETMG